MSGAAARPPRQHHARRFLDGLSAEALLATGSLYTMSGLPVADGAPYDAFSPLGRRRRTYISEQQQQRLEEMYRRKNWPSAAEKQQLADELAMPLATLQVWFQNRRARAKRQRQEVDARPAAADDNDSAAATQPPRSGVRAPAPTRTRDAAERAPAARSRLTGAIGCGSRMGVHGHSAFSPFLPSLPLAPRAVPCDPATRFAGATCATPGCRGDAAAPAVDANDLRLRFTLFRQVVDMVAVEEGIKGSGEPNYDIAFRAANYGLELGPNKCLLYSRHRGLEITAYPTASADGHGQ